MHDGMVEVVASLATRIKTNVCMRQSLQYQAGQRVSKVAFLFFFDSF